MKKSVRSQGPRKQWKETLSECLVYLYHDGLGCSSCANIGPFLSFQDGVGCNLAPQHDCGGKAWWICVWIITEGVESRHMMFFLTSEVPESPSLWKRRVPRPRTGEAPWTTKLGLLMCREWRSEWKARSNNSGWSEPWCPIFGISSGKTRKSTFFSYFQLRFFVQ